MCIDEVIDGSNLEMLPHSRVGDGRKEREGEKMRGRWRKGRKRGIIYDGGPCGEMAAVCNDEYDISGSGKC